MKKILFEIILICCLLVTSNKGALAQQESHIIGDKIKDIELSGIYFNGDQQASLSDLYKKGGLIINFWATWCMPCLSEQKRLDSLMESYPALSVLSATYEDPKIVQEYFAKAGLPRSKSMIIIAKETKLHSIFKHRTLPHNIWVDKEGIIKTSTGGDEINEKNIGEFLKGSTKGLNIKTDDLSFDFRKMYHVPDSMIRFRTYISDFNPDITSGFVYGTDENGDFKRFFAWNRPMVQLFWLAYTNMQNYRVNWNLVELKTSDSVRFFQPGLNPSLFERSRYNNGDDLLSRKRKWDRDNLFCYELSLPHKVSARLSSEYMYPDLEKFFKVRATIKRKRIITNVVSLNKEKPVTYFNQDKGTTTLKFHDGNLIIKSISLDQLLQFLTMKYEDRIPYVNETGYNDKLNFIIENTGSEITLKQIWTKLNELGFVMTPKKRSYPILVLEDFMYP